MSRSGLPIIQSLKLLEQYKGKRAVKYLARDLRVDLEHGDSLAKACHAQRKRLTPFFVAMVSAGERNGTLGAMFQHLEHYYTDLYETQQRAQQKLMYPIMCIFIFLFMMDPIVMFFQGIASGGVDFVGIFKLFVKNLFLAIIGLIPYLLAIRLIFMLITLETIFVYIPTVRLALQSRFCTTMSLLCTTGMQFPQALVIAARVTALSRMEAEAIRLAKRIQAGETLSDVLCDSTFFPVEYHVFITNGEQSGKLDEAFAHVAKSLYVEVSHKITMAIIWADFAFIMAYVIYGILFINGFTGGALLPIL